LKLYQTRYGPNPRRVIIYLAEKGIDLPRVEVDTAAKEQKSPAFLAMNPAGRVPVLELDDGRTLSESAAIVEYLEELYPDPPMIGVDPFERAKVRALERIGNDLIVRTQLWLMHSQPHFASRVVQQPAVAEAARPWAEALLAVLEQHIGESPFLAGDKVTIADCTVFPLFQLCRVRMNLPYGADYPRLDAWYARFSERPSAAY
jgi:glutathione S-transferase